MWNAMVIGPDDTPFEDGTFKLVLQFTEKYPNEPPKVKFQTNMFHPNIYADGQLCLDILARKWSPTFDVLSILISVQSLLGKKQLQRVPSFAYIPHIRQNSSRLIKSIYSATKSGKMTNTDLIVIYVNSRRHICVGDLFQILWHSQFSRAFEAT